MKPLLEGQPRWVQVVGFLVYTVVYWTLLVGGLWLVMGSTGCNSPTQLDHEPACFHWEPGQERDGLELTRVDEPDNDGKAAKNCVRVLR